MSEQPTRPEVTVAQAHAMVAAGTAALVDVRRPDEWHEGHAPQARHLPLDELNPAELPDDRPLVVICRSGNRSAKATDVLRAAGLDARNVTGGMQQWAADGFDVRRGDGSAGVVA